MALLWPLPVHHHHAHVGLITRPHMQSCLILLTARAVYSMTVTRKQVWEVSQLPLGKHSAQLVGADMVDILDSRLPAPSVPPAVDISQRDGAS